MKISKPCPGACELLSASSPVRLILLLPLTVMHVRVLALSLAPIPQQWRSNADICLVTGSPAIDAVNNGTCPPPATDQRGIGRPQDGNGDGGPACDIGTYELVALTQPP